MNHGRIRLGQIAAPAAIPGAAEAVSAYDSLMARVPLIANQDARGEILKWVGRSDQIGSPAERYTSVVSSVPGGPVGDDLLRERVSQLEAINAQLKARVENAENAYGTLSAPEGAGSTPEAATGGLCLAGGIALLGLVIVPLILE